MNSLDKIRNFGIIAHIDHGKSTLSDRLLEVTKTVEKRKMKEQVLDQMELERERGITIKMQPVRMEHKGHILNLIDTPGHIDFTYEVSRALKAVEGVILLVDATQGIQAQTLSVLEMAKEMNLVIIPVLNKIDLPAAMPEEIAFEVAELLDVDPDTVHKVSGKTGEGANELLDIIVEKIPAPQASDVEGSRGLIFDFQYSSHKGIIIYTRIFDGEINKGDSLKFSATGKTFNALEVGVFKPVEVATGKLLPGEIGYIVTGIKEPGIARVGDTVTKGNVEALAGYEEPQPVVWASVYPENQDDFNELRQSLEKLRLSDSSFSFEEESSGTLGKGFRVGFLGMLHLEIITERLKREFRLDLIIASPTISYEINHGDGKTELVYSAAKFPEDSSYDSVREPWVSATIITPGEYVGPITQLLYEHEAVQGETESFSGGRMALHVEMPLRELMRNFFDRLKSASSGFASLSYEQIGLRDADITRLDILVADERIPAFSRVVSKRQAEGEAKAGVERLHDVLPRQQFDVKIQGKALGRIISSKKISALRKDVTGYLYGGDVTRKKKLLEKQKKGKKKLKQSGKVSIPQDVFLKMTRTGD